MNGNTDILLDYIFDLQSRISDFVSPDVECIFNRPHHRFDSVKLKESLIRLNDDGYIYFLNDDGQAIDHRSTNVSELNHRWFVSLTEEGGKHWEAVYLPDWKKYLVIDSDPSINEASEAVDIQGGSKEIIGTVIRDIKTKTDIFNLTSIQIVSPWKATYWKTLDIGYSINMVGPENLSALLAGIVSTIKWRKGVRHI